MKLNPSQIDNMQWFRWRNIWRWIQRCWKAPRWFLMSEWWWRSGKNGCYVHVWTRHDPAMRHMILDFRHCSSVRKWKHLAWIGSSEHANSSAMTWENLMGPTFWGQCCVELGSGTGRDYSDGRFVAANLFNNKRDGTNFFRWWRLKSTFLLV